MAIKIAWADIVQLLQQGEGPTLEFVPKVKNENDLASIIVSFANAQGGTIVVGIDDKNGHLNGFDQTKEWVAAVCKDKCDPAVNAQIGEFVRNEKRIIVMQVKEGAHKPYKTVDGNVLTREGAVTRVASKEEQKELNPWGVGGINPRQKKALEYISENDLITNKLYREICDVSHKTAHIELTELVEKGVLRIQGQGRSTAYVLAPDTGNSNSQINTFEYNKQELPNDGQLFKFEEDEDENEVPVVKKAPKKIKKAPKIVEIDKKVQEKEAPVQEIEVKDEEQEEIEEIEEADLSNTFEPPEIKEDFEEELEEDSPPIIAGDDYEDTSPTAKAPDVDKDEDAASPSFLDL